MKVPVWHKRFMEAQNLMSQATGMMKQACLEDRNNKTFGELHAKMISLFLDVCAQSTKNLARGRKEGWLK